MKITAHLDDGTHVDVTTAVQILYDGVDAMEQGSGFLDADEQEAVEYLGTVTGWAAAAEAAKAEAARDKALRDAEYARVRAEGDARLATHDWNTNITWPCTRCGLTRTEGRFTECP
jgi:hypothetical protein